MEQQYNNNNENNDNHYEDLFNHLNFLKQTSINNMFESLLGNTNPIEQNTVFPDQILPFDIQHDMMMDDLHSVENMDSIRMERLLLQDELECMQTNTQSMYSCDYSSDESSDPMSDFETSSVEWKLNEVKVISSLQSIEFPISIASSPLPSTSTTTTTTTTSTSNPNPIFYNNNYNHNYNNNANNINYNNFNLQPKQTNSTPSSTNTSPTSTLRVARTPIAQSIPSPRISASLTTSNGAGPVKRSEKSLKKICDILLDEFRDCSRMKMDLETLKTKLKVNKRRFYEILNVMECLGVVTKEERDTFFWNGLQHIRPNIISIYVNSSAELNHSTNGFSTSDASSETSEPSIKSISNLCHLFIKLFFSRHQVSIADAKEIYNLESMPAKCKRLYDIANILDSLGIIGKVPKTGSKQYYQWLGPPTIEEILTSTL
ncbi:hypothetical protein PPL_01634 [Heterostelium album PN500]|uniref:E2F/DP family winged-helix DNA-binding domain-containing protein n=1 Tax=Heterostelium pallidum (strain ATCC 26659 / Pp 5 / PN500) TaxID=670386 RepID=D3B020_HETP5|nr:hypothetical protein PPL_01634 [Heterostelium album PN500]EFA84644.1 hypothetical protein PPL_01634 [Heterostelium album PN500]|eukprot:XP_020436757.1 hypothetical protein PPL_01634 [Heterostelium album PN500]